MLTQVEVCCSPVGEENSVDFQVPTVLLQTCSVGQYGFLVVLLLEKCISLIFQALCLLWGGKEKSKPEKLISVKTNHIFSKVNG